MNAVAYRVRAVLRRRWKSAVAVMIVVSATGALTLTLVAGTVRTSTAPDRYVEAAGLTVDVGIEQSGGRPRTDEVSALPAVHSVAAITFLFGGLVPADEALGDAADGGANGYGFLDSLVFAGTRAALGGRIIEGRDVDPTQPGEFVASRSFAQGANATVGQNFRLLTISADQAAASGFDVAEPAGPTIEATLVGIFEGSATLQDDYPVSVFPPTILDGTDIGVSASQMAVDLVTGATAADLRTDLDSLPRGDTFAINALEVVPEPVRAAVRTQVIGLLILAAIVAVAAAAVTGQLLGREVQLPQTQRTALHTLGMTRDQLTAEAVGTAAVPVVVGAAVAAVVSLASSSLFPLGFARQVEPHPGVRFEPLVHLLGPILLAGVLLGWLAVGFLHTHRSSQLRAAGAGDFASRVYPPQAATALRFMFSRNRGDTGSPRAQTSALVVLVVLAVGAATFGANVARLLDEPVRQGVTELAIGAGGGEIPQEVRDLLAADPDVEVLTMFGAIVVSVGSQSFHVVGALPVVGDFAPTVLDGRLPVADDEIVLGRVEARRLGVDVGDDLDVAGAVGTRALRVTGIAVIPGIEGGEGLGEGGFMSLAGLRTLDPNAPVNAGALRLRPGATDGTVDRLSQAIGMGMGPIDPPTEIISLERVRSIPFVLVAVLSLFAVLSLAHQLIQSSRRRRRDMAILRALGATRGWVSAVVHWQATLLTLAVAAVAVPLGYIAGRATYRIVADRIGAQNDVVLPLVALSVLIATLAVFANIAAAIPSRRVRKLTTAGFLNQE